jgi:hypothetical protein
MNGSRELRLPEELCAAAEKKFAGRFQNVEALLEFVLRDLLRDEDSALDQAEQQAIEQRLKDLGYL